MKWIIVIIAAFVLQQFLPWWSIAIAGFLFGFIVPQENKAAFFNGFAGLFILWGGIATYVYITNDALLANRLAELMSLPHGLLIVLFTALIGGLTGGLSSLSGKYLRNLIKT